MHSAFPMSLRKALVMVTLLLALGAYIYFVELAKEKEEADKKKLFAFDKDAVTAVTLTYPDRALQLKKDPAGKWQLTQPIEVEADETTVINLLSALADVEVKRTLDEPPQDLALYGLNTPAVKLQVTLKDSKTLPAVAIGEDTPVGFSVYVQKEGDPKIFLTPQSFRLGMTKEVKDLRDKTVLAFAPDEGKKLYVKRGEKETLFLVGDWVLRDLHKTAADFRDKTVARFAQDQAARVEVKPRSGDGFTLTRSADKKWGIDKTREGTLKEASL